VSVVVMLHDQASGFVPGYGEPRHESHSCRGFETVAGRPPQPPMGWYPRPDSNRRYRLERATYVGRIVAGQRLYGRSQTRHVGMNGAQVHGGRGRGRGARASHQVSLRVDAGGDHSRILSDDVAYSSELVDGPPLLVTSAGVVQSHAVTRREDDARAVAIQGNMSR
jgi:hypothetical protein